MKAALQQYRAMGAHSAVQDADPHRLVQMLFHGALDRLSQARGCIARGDVAGKCQHLDRALKIVTGLKGAVDLDAGALAANLDALYEYIGGRIVEANARSDSAIVEEVMGLLAPISQAWDQSAEAIRQVRPRATAEVAR